MSEFVSTAKPFTTEWMLQHMAYDAGRKAAEEEGVGNVTGRDRDETRRLLYMALYAGQTPRYSLVGTLVNALAHHGSGLDPDEVGEHVLTVVAEYTADREARNASTAWLRAQIERLSAEESQPEDANG